MEDRIAANATLLLIVLFLSRNLTAEQQCRTKQSISNRALQGHVISASTTTSVERCNIKCEREPDCYSINYILSTKSCELNKGTRLSHPKDFLPRENTVYIDSLYRRYHACVHPPCQNGGTCITLPQSPGYKCLCQPNYSGDDCQVCNENALGMYDKSIPNSAISASSSEPDSPPSSGRIYSSGGWRAQRNDTNPYLEIIFTSAKLLTVVGTQGWKDPKNVSSDCWTKEYFLKYKNNGTGWIIHKDDSGKVRVFSGNTNSGGNKRNRINRPFHCTAVRIQLIKWYGHPCMRSEVYGCAAYG